MPQDPIKWGFIGAGPISGTVAQQAAASGTARLVGVWGRDEERTRIFAREQGFDAAFADLDELLGDDAIEAVYVALPHALHVDVVLRALDAGKHVLCEKPLGMNAAEVARVRDHPASRSLRVAEGFMVRHQPQWQWIASRIAEGAIGGIRLVQSHSSVPLPEAAATLPGQGSLLLDIACYPVHLIRTIFGAEPHTVSAFAGIENGRDVTIAAQMQFLEGWAQLFVSRKFAPTRRMHIVGESGNIEVFAPIHAPPGGGSRVVVTSQGQTIERLFPAIEQYGLQFADFARAVRKGTEPLVDLDNALANARCLDAVRQSFEQQGRLIACC